MGLLTTITFRNDAFHDIEKDPEGTVRNILRAMNGEKVTDNNIMVAQMPVHSHDSAVYVCKGNTTVNVSSFTEMDDIMRNHTSFFGDLFAALGSCYGAIRERWSIVKKEMKG